MECQQEVSGLGKRCSLSTIAFGSNVTLRVAIVYTSTGLDLDCLLLGSLVASLSTGPDLDCCFL